MEPRPARGGVPVRFSVSRNGAGVYAFARANARNRSARADRCCSISAAFAARQSRTYWFRLVPFASAHSLTSCTIAGGIDNVMLIFASYTAFAALSSHVFYQTRADVSMVTTYFQVGTARHGRDDKFP